MLEIFDDHDVSLSRILKIVAKSTGGRKTYTEVTEARRTQRKDGKVPARLYESTQI
jgi:hypothetical protein